MNQVAILVSKEVRNTVDSLVIEKCVAKAPIKAVARCFDSSEAFVGRFENQHYQKVVSSWIDDDDADVVILQTDSNDANEAYKWTAEMMGIPSTDVMHKGKLVCTVLGPGGKQEITDLTLGTSTVA